MSTNLKVAKVETVALLQQMEFYNCILSLDRANVGVATDNIISSFSIIKNTVLLNTIYILVTDISQHKISEEWVTWVRVGNSNRTS